MRFGIVIKDDANIYMTSTYKGKVIDSVKRDDRVEILGVNEPYYRVRYNKCYIGFIFKEDVEEV